MSTIDTNIDFDDLFLSRDPEFVSSLLGDWIWLIGSDVIPFAASIAGDAFVVDSDKNVLKLDCGSGELIQLTNSVESFYSALNDLENRNDWLLANFVEHLRSHGLVLRKGECYSFIVLPIFVEGTYDFQNMMAISANEHFALTGSLHKQLSQQPDGSKVQIKIVP